jgi:hypothetical protein
MVKLGNAQAAVDEVVSIVRHAGLAFDTVSKKLLEKYQDDRETHRVVEQYIRRLQTACTGHLLWT